MGLFLDELLQMSMASDPEQDSSLFQILFLSYNLMSCSQYVWGESGSDLGRFL